MDNEQINKITSIELDRSKPFRHVIRIKQGDFTLETIPVKETNGNEVLQIVTKAWLEAISK